MTLICASSYTVPNDSPDFCDCGKFRLIDPSTACERLGAGDSDLLQLVNDGIIPAFQIGALVRVCGGCVDGHNLSKAATA